MLAVGLIVLFDIATVDTELILLKICQALLLFIINTQVYLGVNSLSPDVVSVFLFCIRWFKDGGRQKSPLLVPEIIQLFPQKITFSLYVNKQNTHEQTNG